MQLGGAGRESRSTRCSNPTSSAELQAPLLLCDTTAHLNCTVWHACVRHASHPSAHPPAPSSPSPAAPCASAPCPPRHDAAPPGHEGPAPRQGQPPRGCTVRSVQRAVNSAHASLTCRVAAMGPSIWCVCVRGGRLPQGPASPTWISASRLAFSISAARIFSAKSVICGTRQPGRTLRVGQVAGGCTRGSRVAGLAVPQQAQQRQCNGATSVRKHAASGGESSSTPLLLSRLRAAAAAAPPRRAASQSAPPAHPALPSPPPSA